MDPGVTGHRQSRRGNLYNESSQPELRSSILRFRLEACRSAGGNRIGLGIEKKHEETKREYLKNFTSQDASPFKAWTGKLAKGIVGNSAKSVQNDRDRRQQETFELRIKLVVLRFPLGHESSKTPEFSAEWMINKDKQAVQKLKSGSTNT